MSPLRSLWSWLTAKEVREPGADDVVVLRICRTFQEAHELTELLKHTGVNAEIFADEASDRSSGAGFTELGETPWGVRVMILGADSKAAGEVLADYEEELQRRYRKRETP